MSMLTFLRLWVRAPRIRIVSIGESANIHEPPSPAPTPRFGEFNSPHELERAASEPFARGDLRAAPLRDVHHPSRVRALDPGAPGMEPATGRHRHGRVRPHARPPADP